MNHIEVIGYADKHEMAKVVSCDVLLIENTTEYRFCGVFINIFAYKAIIYIYIYLQPYVLYLYILFIK